MSDTQPAETLNDLLQGKVEEWDCAAIVEALRVQSERWNHEQSIGSRARVTSKKIPASSSKAQAIKEIIL